MLLKKFSIIPTICLFLILSSTKCFAQKTDISDESLWILILPGTITVSYDQTLESEITDIVTDIAWETGRFEIFDRFDVRNLLWKNYPDKLGHLSNSVILELGKSTECDEVLLIDILTFSQVGVPPVESNVEEEDSNIFESIFDGLFSGDSEDYSDNIQTNLTVQFRNIDLVSGEEIDRFLIRVSHTGGTKKKSKQIAVENFRDIAYNEVRVIYQLVSEVIVVDGMDLDLRFGTNLRITGNTLFKIIEPERMELVEDEEIFHPGESAGLACVQSVGDTAYRSQIIRQWSPIGPGFYAYEFDNNIHGIQFYFLPKFPGDYMYIGGQFHMSPLGSWDFGGGMHYLAVTDSYDETDHGLGFSIFGSIKLITLTTLTIHAKIGSNLDIPFKKDDDLQTVNTAIFSQSLGISCILIFTKKSDIEINIGYRLSTKSSLWTYSEKEEEFDAFWYDDPPVVDLSGFYFTIGYKFILF